MRKFTLATITILFLMSFNNTNPPNKFKNHFSTISDNPVIPQPNSNGGIVVYQSNGHGLIASPEDLGKMDWHSAKKACDDLKLNGFSDWHLPNQKELEAVVGLHLDGIGGFAEEYYWSNQSSFPGEAYMKHFAYLAWGSGSMDEKHNVRAVRTF